MIKEDFMRLKTVLRGWLIIFIFYLSSVFKYIPIYIFKLNIDKVKSSVTLSLLLSIFSALCISLIFIFLYRKELLHELKTFKDKFLECIDTGFACWIIGLIIMMISNLIISYVFNAGGAKNENTVQSLITAAPFLMSFEVCLLAPFNEEIVFRKAIRDISINKYLFVIVSFLFFGGAHVIGMASSLTDFLYIIPYGTLGAVFAIAYVKTDSIFTSVTFHMLHNTILFVLSLLI